MTLTVNSAIATFGARAKEKLSNPAATGQPEDQLRAPFEHLLADLADLSRLPKSAVAAVGELSISDLKTRPDYAITVRNVLVGFVELKSPGKGADPRKFKDPHDKAQWDRLRSLPNLIYSDGNAFSLWQNGELVDSVITLIGDIESSGNKLEAPPGLLNLFESFLRWEPIPPRSARDLAHTTARLCRLLRDEVTEQLALGSEALTGLAADWRKLLFPDATDERFADGYAQAVTFGMLMARAKKTELSQTSSLIGAALKLLTDNAENQKTLKTSLETLKRVLDAVNWSKISAGLASPSVTLADPATGTGTFLLGVLRRIAETVTADEGEGAVKEAINAAVKRLIAFEMQLGPFAVAQLRILAEIVDLTGFPPRTPVRMFVTNTLGNPEDDEGYLPQIVAAIAKSRKEANKIKRDEPITVVIGNPPYKERAKGAGGWIEVGSKNPERAAPLADWMPPKEWKVGAHSKHLRNLYIYFWRWATWKVYDHGPGNKSGIVCFITVAGFLNGPGFQKMRDYMRRTCEDIWVIDCSPEGYQPEVNTRIFQDVQQPVCIVLASRSSKSDANIPAKVVFQALPSAHRSEKFRALGELRLGSKAWVECPSEWRAPFLPASQGAWASYPKLEDLFAYNGSGVMPGRTWVIAPDIESLEKRWEQLILATADKKEILFHPHLANGKLGDRHSNRVVIDGLPGYEGRKKPVAGENGPCVTPVRYGFRSFDRQWIIPDNRVINRPNPELWRLRSDRQVYMTAFAEESPTNGPALTFTGLIPDLHHYKGSFGGRVFPLWRDQHASVANMPANLLNFLGRKYGIEVNGEDLIAYIAGIAAHPAFTSRFQDDLSTPGLRIPLTSERDTFAEVADLGRTIIWLHTFGERMIDPQKGRPAQPPRLPAARMPRIPAAGAIPQDPAAMPDSINYDASKKRLLVGQGYVENVEPGMWHYEVSGKQVVLQWFSYRKANRERPIIGDRRTPSPLSGIQPDHWLAEYTTELINVLNVLGRLVDLEPAQAALLEKVCAGPTILLEELSVAGAFQVATKPRRGAPKSVGPGLFDASDT